MVLSALILSFVALALSALTLGLVMGEQRVRSSLYAPFDWRERASEEAEPVESAPAVDPGNASESLRKMGTPESEVASRLEELRFHNVDEIDRAFDRAGLGDSAMTNTHAS